MSSVSALPAPSALYREDQPFAWWTYALMAAMVALACLFLMNRPQAIAEGDGLRSSLAITAGFALPALFVLGVLRMTTVVSGTHVTVWFGYLPTYTKSVSVFAVASVEVVTYRPIADCGGWGIRSGPDGERVLNARGNRGVRLRMADGTRLLIGSQDPEALARAIEGARRPIA